MSIEVELHNKGGQVCKQAKAGEIHCPLIVRPTSEDVVTGNVFGLLRYVRPHLWLNPMLNHALDTDDFRQVWFKDFSLRLWERQARFPPELLDFREGRTEPDVVIEWENPPTTVWIEAKWNSPIARSSSNSCDNDQFTRDLRALQYTCGQIQTNRLIDPPKRRSVLLGLLVEVTTDENFMADQAVNRQGDMNVSASQVGLETWRGLQDSLSQRRGTMTCVERQMAKRIQAYVEHKLVQRRQVGTSEDRDQLEFG